MDDLVSKDIKNDTKEDDEEIKYPLDELICGKPIALYTYENLQNIKLISKILGMDIDEAETKYITNQVKSSNNVILFSVSGEGKYVISHKPIKSIKEYIYDYAYLVFMPGPNLMISVKMLAYLGLNTTMTVNSLHDKSKKLSKKEVLAVKINKPKDDNKEECDNDKSKNELITTLL